MAGDKQQVLTKAVLRAAEQLDITTAQLSSVLGIGRTTVNHLVSGNYELSPSKKEWEIGALFVRMYLALDVLVSGSQADAQKWLNSGNAAFGSQKPIQLIPTIEGLVRVMQYLESSIRPRWRSNSSKRRTVSILETVQSEDQEPLESIDK